MLSTLRETCQVKLDALVIVGSVWEGGGAGGWGLRCLCACAIISARVCAQDNRARSCTMQLDVTTTHIKGVHTALQGSMQEVLEKKEYNNELNNSFPFFLFMWWDEMFFIYFLFFIFLVQLSESMAEKEDLLHNTTNKLQQAQTANAEVIDEREHDTILITLNSNNS